MARWVALRGPGYIYKRAIALGHRYGITSSKAEKRTTGFVAALAEHGCVPTLPTPGCVVQHHPDFIRHLQDAGAEIAVHSYDHVDLTACSPPEAAGQLARAAQIFNHNGIEVRGFRCPYLRCTDALLDALPGGVFEYSSNRAVRWNLALGLNGQDRTMISDVLGRIYAPLPATHTVCVPQTQSNLIEIPACLPDDLELHDGRGLDPDGMAQAWSQMLHETHQRGEACVILFHPELAEQCLEPLVTLVREAKALRPAVWIARLCDISDWWQEKSGFAVRIGSSAAGLHVSFDCSERATILTRGLEIHAAEHAWDGSYKQLTAAEIDVPAEPRPFIGLPGDAPEGIVSFLREQGYILDSSELATRCGTYLDAATLAGLTNEVRLIAHIEASSGPLIRYWRWPSGVKSVLSVTGDLDALSLMDYLHRLFA